MAAPKTYLMVAPAGAANLLGQSLTSADIVRGLRRINPSIVAGPPTWADPVGPTQQLGILCLWLGDPELGRKITSLRVGEVPEFTQLSPEGALICKGWRAVFGKVIKAGAATQGAIERTFRVSLAQQGEDLLCQTCIRQGQRRPHNGGKAKLCEPHERRVKDVRISV